MSSCAPGCGNKMIKMTPVTGYSTPNDLKFNMISFQGGQSEVSGGVEK